ncbi:transposase, partial [Hungatella sp.]|uniref:transposase n=1 Tax=Hungatella sp. TaxID=2613924 RepID=UPI002A822847
RKLKKLREKETRYVTAVNHGVTKALISQYGAGTLFIIEDLTGIRTVTEHVRLKSRYVMVSWAFFQFRKMLEYKAALSQSEVLAVDPKYTSQSCPVCGNTTKVNRNRRKHEFCCTVCSYRSNDDRTGAINIYRKGWNTLFTEACQA